LGKKNNWRKENNWEKIIGKIIGKNNWGHPNFLKIKGRSTKKSDRLFLIAKIE